MKASDRQAKRGNYIAKANEAERQALKSYDATTRAAWERMARQYKKMADEMQSNRAQEQCEPLRNLID